MGQVQRSCQKLVGPLSELLSAVLGALIATAGGFLALRQATEHQTKRTIAATLGADYMARFSEPAFVAVRDEVDICLASMRGLQPGARLERFTEICRRQTPESVRLYNRLHSTAMLFAEIGVGFHRGLIDAEGLAIFDRILPYYWWELSPFIAAAHREFGFVVDHARPLSEQRLVLFSKFAYAYNEMVSRGIAREARPVLDHGDGDLERDE